jgi:DNA mismatch endonuclease (patch repair protein)
MARSSASWASSPRSRTIMQRNKARDTGPELAIRSAVHRRGLRYRVCARPLPDLRRTADLLFTSARVAVFIDGCFWHGCPEHHVLARSNRDYWAKKISQNRLRDSDTHRRLVSAGWIPLRIWTHAEPEQAADIIVETIEQQKARSQPSRSRQQSSRTLIGKGPLQEKSLGAPPMPIP